MNKTQSHLTNAILNSIVRKIDYWLNQLNGNNDEPIVFFEGEHFIWDITDTLQIPGLAINHPSQIVKIWWSHDEGEKEAQFFSNLHFSAEENLSFYIELEQLILNDVLQLEQELEQQIRSSFNTLPKQ